MRGNPNRILTIALVAMLVLALAPAAAFAGPAAKSGGARAAALRPQVVVVDDPFESDDSSATATDIDEIGYGITRHSLPNRPERVDEDWVKFSAEETGQPFILQSTFVDGYLDMWMYLYEPKPDGTLTQLVNSDDMTYFEGYGSEIFFVAPHPGEYYVQNYARDDNFGYYDLFVDSALARRVAGANRYETSVAISKMMWPDTKNPDYDWGPQDIVVANDGSIDALTGGAFAALFTHDTGVTGVNEFAAPLLLTKRDVLPTVVKDEIARLAVGATSSDSTVTVWVLGGTDKVSDAVMEEIEQLPNVYAVKRVAGANRFATAAEIASAGVEVGHVDDTAFVVGRDSIADALSAGPLSLHNGAPILLTGAASLSNETSQWLADHPGVSNAIIVGGEDKVGSTVATELADMGLTVDRVAGANRYETSALLARYAIDQYGATPDGMVLASGQKFADGLCGAPMAAMIEGPLLLTPGSSLADTITTYYDDNPTSSASYILGGYPTISEDVELDFDSLWVKDPEVLTRRR